MAAGGAPVQGAEVCADTEDILFNPKCVSTAADGSYEIAALFPVHYTVDFSGGITHPFLVAQETEVTVTSGTTITGVDAALVEGGAIVGVVTDAVSGTPLARVEVCSWSEPSEEPDGCTVSASNGNYELTGIPAGLHELEFWDLELSHKPALILGAWVFVGVKSTQNAALISNVPQPSGSSPQPSGSSPQPTTSSPSPSPVAVTQKPLQCPQGKVKKRVKGKTRCVKRHKPRHHRAAPRAALIL